MKFKGIFGDRSEGQVRWPVVRARLALSVSPSARVGEPLLVPGSALGLAGHTACGLNLEVQIFVNHGYLCC